MEEIQIICNSYVSILVEIALEFLYFASLVFCFIKWVFFKAALTCEKFQCPMVEYGFGEIHSLE